MVTGDLQWLAEHQVSNRRNAVVRRRRHSHTSISQSAEKLGLHGRIKDARCAMLF
jgi:hypothetical protein